MIEPSRARDAGGGPDDVHTGLSADAFKRAYADNLRYTLGRFPAVATPNDRYLALAHAVRDRLMDRWMRSGEAYYRAHARTVCYLSAEYLLGPHLGNNLLNLGVLDEARQAMEELGLDFDRLLEQEEEPGLGNGGLGRLAACYMDSLATLQVPAIGYGIRYEFGIFDQAIRDGWQVEVTDKWLHLGNPWEIAHPEISFEVGLGGHTGWYTDEDGRERACWFPERVVRGEACDTPILGYRTGNANLLRLWRAEATESFDFQAFNVGDYWGAVEEKVSSETISKVLYPNDEPEAGRRLRLAQQYFFVSCSLQDMIRLHLQTAPDVRGLDERYATQLNDTHPAIAVAELMRLLMDEHALGWEEAWEITRRTFGYTNHTLLPEALETWPVDLFGSLLPRHLEIVYEINTRFLDEVRRRFPGDEERVRRMSLIDEAGGRSVRMAHLASVGSHTINGVAALHSDLLKRHVLRDFDELWPSKIRNVTNGVTPRRFVALINPGLARLVTEAIGDGWIRNLEELQELEPLAGDEAFRAEWRRVKHANKEALAAESEARAGVLVDPGSLFDIQVKRIHEYKRQHLNILHAITLYRRLKKDPGLDVPSRTVFFAGKAAPGYFMAKRIIKLVHSVGAVVNTDPGMRGRLRIVFLPDYNVKNCQRIFPAADLSEQISTAGKEASGTGNMKFALNGALTIGTLDGANVEIREAVGPDNFFLFGLTVDEVQRLRADGYQPRDRYDEDEGLRDALDALAAGEFSGGDREVFRPLVDNLLHDDPFLVLADYRAYVDAQAEVETAWRDEERWTRASILNAARSGRFSSDRSIYEYCRDIWHVEPLPLAEVVGEGEER
ncbi:MAG: glycogen/starch/alpha-glucan phosphorylase [Acidobacteria bacterium]|jgi:starch phosphorylase|nr:glycogen/starch/alpha-glucan phosphorylase [Acidobacteriota bacterium]